MGGSQQSDANVLLKRVKRFFVFKIYKIRNALIQFITDFTS